MSGHVKPGPPPKGGVRHSVRFKHLDVYEEAQELWEQLGFDSFSTYVDFTFSLAHGKWQEFGFKTADEAADYLLSLARGARVRPPHLRGQEMLPLTVTAA
ncbi:hypothetical protein [Nonomuraea dietziae]|jgi:hypothetical protein|uniref:hypothetical protein n=1 Tax=Nonomuraea dietziae TaxID=65515 RepID=UPI003409DE2A